MTDFLDRIRRNTEQRVENLNVANLRQAASLAPYPADFLGAFAQPNLLAIIAEIKFASPSAGLLRQGNAAIAVEIAKSYLAQGAAALSVLTEPTDFQGDLAYLQAIRSQFPNALLLMKDFILSEAQLLQARIHGANAALLIVAMLEQAELQHLYTQACALGLTPLLEIHAQEELDRALSLNPKLIGINNRNLHTLEIDLQHSVELITQIPPDIIAISESGIRQTEDLVHLGSLGFRGFLVGSHLMKSNDPGDTLKTLLRNTAHDATH